MFVTIYDSFFKEMFKPQVKSNKFNYINFISQTVISAFNWYFKLISIILTLSSQRFLKDLEKVKMRIPIANYTSYLKHK